MDNQEKQKSDQRSTKKQPYEPPTATFVPLKMEERLFGSILQCNDCQGSTN